MQSNWLEKQVSLYKSHSDNLGRPATYRDILLSDFGIDLPALMGLRKLDRFAPDYKIKAKPFKSSLQCYTPAALLKSKAAGSVIELSRSGLMQLDFDYEEIRDYDIEELKQAVFSLPFIAFCGLSCSGFGFYALALISEPERLADYAAHCFEILKGYGINPDESKGKKPENLRYLSYDANMLYRETPEPLRVTHFKAKQGIKKQYATKPMQNNYSGKNGLLESGLMQLANVVTGQRWATVQKVAYTIGGINDGNYFHEIENAIRKNPAFDGEENKYIKCAINCYEAGAKSKFNN